MKNRLLLLFALFFFTVCVYGDSIPVISGALENVHSISSVKDFVSYWEILLFVFSLLMVVPFVYIGYLKHHRIPEEKLPYHFKGEYTAKDIIAYIEGLEILFGKRFLRFRKSLEQYDKDSAGDLSKHAEVIDSIIFCIQLNGRRRWTVFWDASDTFLKVIILLFPIIGVFVIIISDIYFDVAGLLLSWIPVIISMPVMLIIFSWFLQFSQYIIKRRGKSVPALSLAFFAVEALINSHVERSFDHKTGNYFYYTTIHQYNNLVNARFGFSSVSVPTSSSIYGNLMEQAISDN